MYIISKLWMLKAIFLLHFNSFFTIKCCSIVALRPTLMPSFAVVNYTRDKKAWLEYSKFQSIYKYCYNCLLPISSFVALQSRDSYNIKEEGMLNVLMHKESKTRRRRETAMLHLLIMRDSYKKQRGGENMTRISMLVKVVILNESSNDSSKAQAEQPICCEYDISFAS